MKKKNSVSEFASERNTLLINNFHKCLKQQSLRTIDRVFRSVADQPAPRFWVSEARAAAMVTRILTGKENLDDMYEEKREMYKEIIRRYLDLRKIRPDDSILDIIFDVVNQPAPRSYISWQRAKILVYDEIKRLKALKQQNAANPLNESRNPIDERRTR